MLKHLCLNKNRTFILDWCDMIFFLTHYGSRWLQSLHPCSHQQQHKSSHMLEEHQHKLGLGHKLVLEHKLGQGHRLVLACKLGQEHTGQKRQPKE